MHGLVGRFGKSTMSPMEGDYDPESGPVSIHSGEELGNLLEVVTQNLPLDPLWSNKFSLMGVPPYNEMYNVQFYKDSDAFDMFNQSCKLHVYEQSVRVNGQYDIGMKLFRKQVLEPVLFSTYMGDTGARVCFSCGVSDVCGVVTLLVGCNRQAVVCTTYVMGYTVQ